MSRRIVWNKSCGHDSAEICDCDVSEEEWLVPPATPMSTYDKVAAILVDYIKRQDLMNPGWLSRSDLKGFMDSGKSVLGSNPKLIIMDEIHAMQ